MFSHFRISFANLPSQEQKKLELYLNLSHLSPISEFVMPTQEQEKWELGQESEFVKSVREIGGGVIGLVNNTNFCITFTSMRLLVERSKVFKFWKFPCQVFVSLFMFVFEFVIVSVFVSFSKYLTQTMVFDCTGGWSPEQGDDWLGLQEHRTPKFNWISGCHRSLGRTRETDVWGRNTNCGSKNFSNSASQILALSSNS